MRLYRTAFGALLLSTVCVQAADRDVIIKSCLEELKMSAKACDCIADRVQKEFSEPQLAFFLGIITKDRAAMATAQKTLSPGDMPIVADKMEQLPQECAAG